MIETPSRSLPKTGAKRKADLPDFPSEWLFPDTLSEATNVQRLMAEKVITEDALGPVQLLAGTDISCNPRDPENIVYAALATQSLDTLKPQETAWVKAQARFPYVPGYLAFREVPALVDAYLKLERKPDLVFVDGHGISHPRGLGIASHFGVLLDIPTIGVAKSILVGKPEGELGNLPGDRVPLVWKDRTIGMVLRTRANVKPVYVATGHRISLDTACEFVVRALSGYRLPEPTRQAHAAANVFRKADGAPTGCLEFQVP